MQSKTVGDNTIVRFNNHYCPELGAAMALGMLCLLPFGILPTHILNVSPVMHLQALCGPLCIALTSYSLHDLNTQLSIDVMLLMHRLARH